MKLFRYEILTELTKYCEAVTTDGCTFDSSGLNYCNSLSNDHTTTIGPERHVARLILGLSPCNHISLDTGRTALVASMLLYPIQTRPPNACATHKSLHHISEML